MLKLYGGARSRASIVQWYLEELQVPYEFVLLDMQAGAHKEPEFLAINPMGKVPAIVDEGCKLWESGAILLYLAEKYNQTISLEQRAQFMQWVLNPLNQIFERQPFLLGEHFSVADVAVGSILAYIPIMLKLDLSAYPAVLNYIKQLSERPAFQKTIGGRS